MLRNQPNINNDEHEENAMRKQPVNPKFDPKFKAGAIMLSDEIGVKKAAEELSIPYRKLIYWRRTRSGCGYLGTPWCDRYLEKENEKRKKHAAALTEEDRQRLIPIVGISSIRPHELITDTTVNKAPAFYSAPDYSTADPARDWEEAMELELAGDDTYKSHLLKAAHAGIPAAQFELGCFYYYGSQRPDSKKDLNLAEIWMTEVLMNRSAGTCIRQHAEETLKEIRREQQKKAIPLLPPELQKRQRALLAREERKKHEEERRKLIEYARNHVVSCT